ncbi:tetratricopeptide repeat protein [Hymenobacter sp. UYCo722]|uniref:tetratricopeptide repeat protein n=1 Tax=Hymenobacter sp. UYCo722 TaxID=3156335 RepID=UPI003391A7F7
MRNGILYLALLLGLTGCLAHQKQSSLLFERGNKEAAAGNYRKALAIYQQLDQQGIERAELYCNMGNVYLKTGRLGLARYYYEHGLRLAPWDSQILANRRLVLQRLDINTTPPTIAEIPRFQFIINKATEVSVSGLLLGAVVVLISVYAGNKRYSRQLSIVASTLLISGAGLVIILLFLRLWSGQDAAIVVAHGSAVRMGPSEAARQIAQIKEGQKVLVVKQYRGWIKVSTTTSRQGWIKLSSAARLHSEE